MKVKINMKRYIKSSKNLYFWSKPFKTNKYNMAGDYKDCQVSTCEFDDGSIGVVFYGEASYILFDANGNYVDGDGCANVRQAKKSCEAFYESVK